MKRICLAVWTVFVLGWPQAWGATAITFVHLNDIYEIQPIEGGKYGGAARVATEITRLKKLGGPLIVTLGGDYLSPSALGTAKVDGEMLAGRQMVDVLNAMGVDWATFGNHEFDVSEAAFRAHLDTAKFQIVSSNVMAADGKPFPKVARSAILQVKAGKRTHRIGLLGVTVDSTIKPWVGYRDAISSAREEIEQLKGRVDAIVALTHLTLAQDAEFLAALPEIALALGGHEHETWLARRGARLVPIVKADANVRSIAVVKLVFNKPGERPSAEVQLRAIDYRIPADPNVAARVTRWVKAGFEGFRQQGFNPETVVATSTELLDGRESIVRNRPGRLTTLITTAIAREAGQADVALFNGGSVRIDDVLPPGPITEYDVIRVLPFGGKLASASFEGGLLARVLDAGENNQGLGGYLHVQGAARGHDGWLVAGKPIEPSARYRVALPAFLLTGGEVNMGFLKLDHPQLHDVRELRDIRRVLIDELRAAYR
jgi:5'-nucleotidase